MLSVAGCARCWIPGASDDETPGTCRLRPNSRSAKNSTESRRRRSHHTCVGWGYATLMVGGEVAGGAGAREVGRGRQTARRKARETRVAARIEA